MLLDFLEEKKAGIDKEKEILTNSYLH